LCSYVVRVACCVLRVACYVLRVYEFTCVPVYLCTCVRVYLSTWFPAARLAGFPVSIPRPRGSRPDMSHPRRD